MVEYETDQRDMHVIRTGQAKAAELRAPSNVTSRQAREGGKEPKAGVGRAFATEERAEQRAWGGDTVKDAAGGKVSLQWLCRRGCVRGTEPTGTGGEGGCIPQSLICFAQALLGCWGEGGQGLELGVN